VTLGEERGRASWALGCVGSEGTHGRQGWSDGDRTWSRPGHLKDAAHLAVPHGHRLLLQVQRLQEPLHGLGGERALRRWTEDGDPTAKGDSTASARGSEDDPVSATNRAPGGHSDPAALLETRGDHQPWMDGAPTGPRHAEHQRQTMEFNTESRAAEAAVGGSQPQSGVRNAQPYLKNHYRHKG
jgi:hypothetical protein